MSLNINYVCVYTENFEGHFVYDRYNLVCDYMREEKNGIVMISCTPTYRSHLTHSRSVLALENIYTLPQGGYQ